jgi:hypothetical protein
MTMIETFDLTKVYRQITALEGAGTGRPRGSGAGGRVNRLTDR